MALYLVETVAQFRMRYVVDTDKAEYAEDTVVMEEAEEFSQHWLGETIVSTRRLSYDEASELFFEDHDYLAGKDIDVANYITKI